MITEIAGRLTGAPEGQRYMAMLWFYCDESYDNPPKTYCVAGLFGEEQTFSKLEENFKGINHRFGVKRFHAAPLNAFDDEYKDWDKHQQIQYSKRCLKAIQKRGKRLSLTAIAMESDEYEKHISAEGRARFGSPYIACFKSCLMMLATFMRPLPEDYKFSVIFERNEYASEAVRVFYVLKDIDPELGKRMGTCTPGQWDENIALQPSDLVAYESMRMLKSRRSKGKTRLALKSLFGVNSSMGFYFDGGTLQGFKNDLETSNAAPGNFFYTARQFYPEFEDGDEWADVERKVALNDRTGKVR